MNKMVKILCPACKQESGHFKGQYDAIVLQYEPYCKHCGKNIKVK